MKPAPTRRAAARRAAARSAAALSAAALSDAAISAAAAFLLLCAPLALAQGQTESQPEYAVVVERDVMVPMTDGTRLAIDIYRPDGSGRFPALLERTPYDKGNSSEIRVGAHEYFAARGYVFMVQDTRGRFASEGEFYPFLDDAWLENRDGTDTVRWIAAQPWSNGEVGLLGGSYTGQTAYMIAPTQPPAMKAMFVRESAADLFDHWVYRGGAFEHAFVTAWSTRTFGPNIVERTFRGDEREVARARLESAIGNLERDFWHLPLSRYPLLRGSPGWKYYYDWLAHNHDGPYWWQQNVGLNHGRFRVPVYHLGGWYDIFLKGTLENFTGIQRNGGSALARGNQKLVIGPWVHGPTNVGKVEVGELRFPGADQVDYNAIRLRWFDRWLKGLDNGVMDEPPVLIYVMGDNRWRTEEAWPLARARVTPYYFHPGPSGSVASLNDGALSPEPPKPPPDAAHPASFAYDPNDPVPTLGGNTLFIVNGPTDHRAADVRGLTELAVLVADPVEGDDCCRMEG